MWAEVNEFDFKKIVRRLYNKTQKPQEWAKQAVSEIRKNYSQAAICEKYDEVFRKICMK